jgi:dihydrofolate reductase
MRKIVLFMHCSLDGFVAGPGGEIDWILIDESMFDIVASRTKESDCALYGRVTYQLMENYWPKAAEKPDATRHDKEHSLWYNSVNKIVLSGSLRETNHPDIRIIRENAAGEIRNLKLQTGRDILVFGSPSVSHMLMAENLIDDYWIFINPILLGQGIPLFRGDQMVKLNYVETSVFPSGVVNIHYEK